MATGLTSGLTIGTTTATLNNIKDIKVSILSEWHLFLNGFKAIMMDLGIKIGVLTHGLGINLGLMKVSGLGRDLMGLLGLGMRLKKVIGLLNLQQVNKNNLNQLKQLKRHLSADLHHQVFDLLNQFNRLV